MDVVQYAIDEVEALRALNNTPTVGRLMQGTNIKVPNRRSHEGNTSMLTIEETEDTKGTDELSLKADMTCIF